MIDFDLDLSKSIPVRQDDPFLGAIPAPDPWAVVSTTPAQPAQQTYILDAKDLKLPDVPEQAREDIREFLTPLLKNVPVKDNDCWNIAQKFMLAANSARVCYVEGCWTHKAHRDRHLRRECDCTEYTGTATDAAPHAYNTVDGYIVDLNVERWTLDEPESSLKEWWHEPFKIYTVDEINKFLSDEIGFGLDGLSITVSIVLERRAADFGMTFSDEEVERLFESCELGHRACRHGLERKIFKPALDRINARLTEAEDART
jgi:hypothetical protein